jgi:putative ABC transport system substrate-binding protein
MSIRLRRRDFIAALGGGAAWPLSARAQKPALPVIGFLDLGMRRDKDLAFPGFRQGLRETGFIEGQNVAIEYRSAENQKDRLPALAAELVERQAAVIVAIPHDLSGAAAKAATKVIPIVFLSGGDPVNNGLVASLNRPGGNLTGVTLLSPALTAKRLNLLHDLAPQAAVVAVLLDSVLLGTTDQNSIFKYTEEAGRTLGVRIIGIRVGGESELEAAFATAIKQGASALLVTPSIFFINHRDKLVALAARHELPTIYQMREYAAAGGLMSYGPSFPDANRQVGVYTGRVLKGEKPADLPVLLPTTFEFVINLKTAKALDLTIPPGIRAIADEIIE